MEVKDVMIAMQVETESNKDGEIPIDTEKENAEVPLLVMVHSLREEMNKLCLLTGARCIYRVPKPLRIRNPEAYTPKVVSIGPIHHKGEGLEAMEEYKRRYLRLFLERVNLSLEDFAEFVKDREASLRECYSDTISLKSSEFVKMMMIDSAFVYEMLVRVDQDEGEDESCRIFNRPFLIIHVVEDMLLLENQIPLIIIADLFRLDKKIIAPPPLSEVEADPFMHLVCKFVNQRPDYGTTSFDINKVSSFKVAHLLDCLRRCLLSPPQSMNPVSPENCCVSMPCFPECHRKGSPPDESGFLESKPESRSILYRLLTKAVYLVLGCLWRCYRPCSNSVPPWKANENSGFGVHVHTITELHQSGVRFAKNTKSTHILDLKFDWQEGTLKIPQIFMGDCTETIFRNLIALEQCHYMDDLLLDGYFCLLSDLIREPRDVELLVQSGILENALGDNKRASNMINDMGQGLIIPPDPAHFEELRRALASYYKVPWHKWRATLIQNYFNNPWAGISVIAAVIILGSTITQAVYAIISK